MKYTEVVGTSIISKRDLRNLIAESPQIVAPTQFNLNDIDSNQAYLKKILRSKSIEVFDDTPERKFFRTGKGQIGFYVVQDKETNTIAYLIRYETKNWKYFGKTVTQVALWRNPLSAPAIGMTREVFFNHLLKDYPTIVSDEQQTEDGRDFWKIRLTDAVAKGFRVGLADVQVKKIDWFDRSGPFSKWLTDRENAWGNDKKLRVQRFLISRDPE